MINSGLEFLYIFPWKSSLYNMHQRTKYQDQNFSSPDIKELVFLKSKLDTWWCHKLGFIIIQLFLFNFYKISNGQERANEGKREVQKFEIFEDERSFFGKIKSFFNITTIKTCVHEFYFWWKKIRIVDASFNCRNNISYIKNLMHIRIYFTRTTRSKFVSLTLNF